MTETQIAPGQYVTTQPITLHRIARVVCRWFPAEVSPYGRKIPCTLDLLRSRRRNADLTRARAAYCMLARRHTGKNLAQIARVIDKDRNTAAHLAETARVRLADRDAMRQLAACERELEEG